MFDEGVRIFPNVEIGEGTTIDGPVVLGKPPRGKAPGEVKLVIGPGSHIRPFTVIYAGSVIGARFNTGQGASIREDNVIGDDCSVGTHAVLEFGNRIGNGCRIHTGCFLELVTLGERVFLGPHVVFTDDPHPMGCPRYTECKGGGVVGDYAAIGANSTILPGIRIGARALVGAGSVVTRDVAPETVVAGSPAELKKRVDQLVCEPGFFERPYVWHPR